MTPIQQMFLGLGGVIKTKYVDEIFSTYLWEGDGSTGRTITNNVKTDEGTLTWIKNRSSVSQNVLTDTVRGANETLYSDSTNGNYTHSDLLTAFTATGFTVGSDAYVNGSGDDYSSWTFKKKEGFAVADIYLNMIHWKGAVTVVESAILVITYAFHQI